MLVTLLRVGSIRFSAYYFAPLYAALNATGHGGLGWFAIAALACVLGCLAIELLNRVADEEEDRVNNPERCQQCDQIGYRRLRVITAALFLLVVLLGIGLWLTIFRREIPLVLIGLAVFIMYNYSMLIRFKSRRWAVLVVLGCPFILPFLLGWTAFAPLCNLPPGLLFVPVFLATLSGAKDLTDVKGDARRGYQSVFVHLVAHRSLWRLGLLLTAPYLVLTALVILGAAPVRLLALIGLAPITFLFVALCRRAQKPEEKTAMREWMYHILLICQLLTLVLLFPSGRLVAVLSGTAVFWIIATRYLHWQVGLRADQLATSITLLRQRAI